MTEEPAQGGDMGGAHESLRRTCMQRASIEAGNKTLVSTQRGIRDGIPDSWERLRLGRHKKGK